MLRNRKGRAMAAASMLAGWVAASQGCVRDAQSVHCAGGFWCPNGMKCGADGKSCLPTSCGDGVVQENEQCDPGLEGETPSCNRDCTRSRCGDGTTNALAGEACDPGSERETKECNYDCTLSQCGDNIVNRAASEECDEGPSSTAEKKECPYGKKVCMLCSQCRWKEFSGPFCGDGVRQEDREDCDEGAGNGAAACAYGTPSCRVCKEDCSGFVQRMGPVCGDGRRDADEACDDGRRNGATACAYGQRECSVCSADCRTSSPGRVSYCGDGVRTLNEACDSFASFACGTCSSTCQQLPLARAAGAIQVRSTGVSAGEGFVVDDGARSVVFEFVEEAADAGAHGVPIALPAADAGAGTDADADADADAGTGADAGAGELETKALAQRIAAAIAARRGAADGGLGIRVDLEASTVLLTNELAGAKGNKPLLPTQGSASIVGFPGDGGVGAIVLQGMSGGAGCAAGEPCESHSDCVHGFCLGKICW